MIEMSKKKIFFGDGFLFVFEQGNRDSHKIERKLSLIHLAPVNNGKSVCPKNKLRPLSWSMFTATEIGALLFCACKQSWRAFVKAFLS